MTAQSHMIRAAVVQAAPIAFDRERTLAKVRALTGDAAHQGAQLMVFPEAFVSAYPRGLSFGAVVGDRSPEGREEYRRYWESAVDIPGPAMQELARRAAQNHVYLVIGVIERDGGTLYCTVVFFAPDGSYLGKHRKLMPTASERLIWGFGDGSTLPVFDTPIGRLGAVICWENYMPLLRMRIPSREIVPAGRIFPFFLRVSEIQLSFPVAFVCFFGSRKGLLFVVGRVRFLVKPTFFGWRSARVTGRTPARLICLGGEDLGNRARSGCTHCYALAR